MSDNDKVHRTLHAAARGELVKCPAAHVAYVVGLLDLVYRGEIAEFKCVSTRRGVDVFVTKKKRL